MLRKDLGKTHSLCKPYTQPVLRGSTKRKIPCYCYSLLPKSSYPFSSATIRPWGINIKAKTIGHSLIQDMSSRWNSAHDMIKRACEQQSAVAAVFQRRRDLTHLELSSSEWRLLEDVAEVLEPYKDVTTYLNSESYPTTYILPGPTLQCH